MLINDLIEEGNVATASLASILVAAQGAVAGGYDVALCRHVWMVSRDCESTLRDEGSHEYSDEFIERISQS
ncbi:hypothetical protein SAMN05444166_7689 [Singulisphaera sp. GP187]|uniref:hypothetical protein n=1 Tax=Singulisphaera sp. GP187 TaxID=1882752 RepID=UPI000928944A|nr:hypothetical protein [Singulisphaera sp. GP187]SIO65419.1 hypothetical protein SAMN05444166_7689 [Singulisphaera sp. GP187]